MHFTASQALLLGALGLAHAADTRGVKRPQFGEVPYGVNVDRCTVPGKAAITFDDGPDIYTKELLDILGRNGVKATFFLCGDNGRFGRPTISDPSGPYPDLVKRMYREGHQIASHSWGHLNFTTISSEERADELLKLESAFVDILGFFPTYFRPPYTSFEGTEGDLANWGYHNVNFDLDTNDFNELYDKSRATVSSALAQKGPAGGSFITLLHEIHELSVTEFLQFVIDEARKYNYEFVTVGECLGDPVNNWYRDPANGGPWGGPAAPPVIKDKTSSSSSSKSESKSESVSSTTSASKPLFSESTKSNSTTTGAGSTTVTSTTQVPKTATPAATSTPTPKPNAGERLGGLGWAGAMMLGALGVFAGL
ncbi:chitin deacetylase [Podospora conica]|nr:chitin deacetylase [Schizothecium conicum]